MGSIFSVPGSRNLWVGYAGPNGEYIRESSGSARKTDPQNFFRERLKAVSNGNFLGPRVEKITVDESYDDLLQDYRTHGKDVGWAEGRTVALTEECRQLLTELRKRKQPEDYLFTRNGAPILDFPGTWDALVTAAGLPELLLHDFRRSAVRNMIRRGVPQKTAREISGHKTDAVFSRYNIVSEADIRDAARKIGEGARL